MRKAALTVAVAVVLGSGAALLLHWRTRVAPAAPRPGPEEPGRTAATPAAAPAGGDGLAGGDRPRWLEPRAPPIGARGAPPGVLRDGTWSEDRWQALPLDRGYGQSLGEEVMVSFNDTLRESMFESRCADEWKPPAGTTRYRADWEIRLVPGQTAFTVEDVKVLDASLSDDAFEECVRRAWVGKRIAIRDGASANTSLDRARVVFPMVLFYGRPPDP